MKHTVGSDTKMTSSTKKDTATKAVPVPTAAEDWPTKSETKDMFSTKTDSASKPVNTTAEVSGTAPMPSQKPAKTIPDDVEVISGEDLLCNPPCRKGYNCVEGECVSMCNPPCRKGYTCVDGECISICNPPCSPGYRCDPNLGDCVPIERIRQRQDQCSGRRIKIDGKCLKAEEIITRGNVYFALTDVFFGMGTAYSAIAPFIVQRVAKRDYYDYEDEWDDYYYDRYNDELAILCTAPQTGMFVIAGALNHGPHGLQKDYLDELGEDPAGGLIAASWILYGASISTATWNILSNLSNQSELRVTSAVFNLIILFTSFTISNVTYGVQKNKLKKAVKKKLSSISAKAESSVKVIPYYSFAKKENRLGLMLLF